MIIQGRKIIIYNENGAAVAGSKSCSINVKCSMLEISSPLTGTYRSYLASYIDWKINIGFLVSSVRTPLVQVGQSMAVKIGLSAEGALPFAGDVENVTTEATALSGSPTNIYYDAVQHIFVGLYENKYYTAWTGGTPYTSPEVGTTFTYNNNVYMWMGTALSGETLSGSVIVEECKLDATVANLSQGSLVMKGNGALT